MCFWERAPTKKIELHSSFWDYIDFLDNQPLAYIAPFLCQLFADVHLLSYHYAVHVIDP